MDFMANISSNWYQTIAKIAESARKAARPVDFFIGIVETVKPLSIRKNQKLLIDEEFLLLTEAVMDTTKEITISWETEDSNNHSHKVKGKKKITYHNALKVGEAVLLLQQEGGQKYLVLDRVGGEVKT